MKKAVLFFSLLGVLAFSGCWNNTPQDDASSSDLIKGIDEELVNDIPQEEAEGFEVSSGGSELEKTDVEMAGEVVVDFFEKLEAKDFEGGLEIFEPEDWEAMASFSAEEEQGDKAKVLENYCASVGTCLKARVLKVEDRSNGDFEVTVNLLSEDGSNFVLGPCCGATEEEMSPQEEFSFLVKKTSEGDFVVVSAPQYRP